MHFENRLKRRMWLGAILGLIPDTIIAAVVAWVFDSGVIGFCATLAGLQALYFALWVKTSIWSWLMYATFNRRYLAGVLHDFLRSKRFPEPSDSHPSVESFFEDIAMDDSQPTALRLSAATELANLRHATSRGRMQEAMQLGMAYEDALIAYKRSFRP